MKRKSVFIFLGLALMTLVLTIGCETTSLETKNCVVMLGDSIFALSGEETEFLEKLSGDQYRTYYKTGAQLEGGMVQTIPSQYQSAKRADSNIRTIIFDGGGNDILIGGQSQCSTPYGSQLSSSCLKIVDTVSKVTNDLIHEMITDGVKNIVMQGYYLSADKDLWEVSEVANERIMAELAALDAQYPNVKIVFVNMQPHFDRNNTAGYLKSDGIHPTTASSEKLANILWGAMAENDIEQGEACTSSNSGSGGCN